MKKGTIGNIIVSKVVGLIAYAVCGAAQYEDRVTVVERPKPPKRIYSFGEAVVAVTESGMCSIDKRDALNDILPNRNSDYYEGVIGIAKSTMCSIDKLQAIKNLTVHELAEEEDN